MFVYRADSKPFGKGQSSRKEVYLPEGNVRSMAAYRDPETGKSFVYVTQAEKTVPEQDKKKDRIRYVVDPGQFVNKITVHDGDRGDVLREIEATRPHGVIVRNGFLFVLQGDGGKWTVSRVVLEKGFPNGNLERVFDVPGTILPSDLEVDRSGRFYLSDTKANKVYQLNAQAGILHTWGAEEQKPGKYDPNALMAPSKLATWTGQDGKDQVDGNVKHVHVADVVGEVEGHLQHESGE